MNGWPFAKNEVQMTTPRPARLLGGTPFRPAMRCGQADRRSNSLTRQRYQLMSLNDTRPSPTSTRGLAHSSAKVTRPSPTSTPPIVLRKSPGLRPQATPRPRLYQGPTNEAGVVHEAKNASNQTVKTISIFVVEKGKPLVQPVK